LISSKQWAGIVLMLAKDRDILSDANNEIGRCVDQRCLSRC